MHEDSNMGNNMCMGSLSNLVGLLIVVSSWVGSRRDWRHVQ